MKLVTNGLFLLLIVVTTCVTLSGSEPPERPNIVFLLADDQCTYSMGCYGNTDVQTPQLDQLARDGLVFENHYDATAICMASRASILTGKYEYRHGCNFGHGHLLRGHWANSYPVLLRSAGYMTAMAGKIGIEVTDQPGGRGELPESDFDRWGAGPGQTSYVTSKNRSIAHYAKEYPHSTLAYGAFGRDFIGEAVRDGRPFCLSISFKAPHRPDTPDPRFDDVYQGKKFQRPQNYGREHGEHFSLQSRQGRQYARFTQWGYDRDYDAVMARYHQQVYGIDVAVGMIRDALREQGVADNTVVIYSSDNGFLCGSHGYGSKVLPYEESSRVPLIIYDPRRPVAGQRLRCNALTGNVDLAPTILELAGVQLPTGLDGVSLVPLCDDPQGAVRESLALMNVWGPPAVHSLSVVTKDWKYVFWPYAEGDFRPSEEIYWLEQDPYELVNCLASNSAPQLPGKADDSKRVVPGRALSQLRALYDKAVSDWQKNAVPYHRYAPYGTVFDRHVAWEQKRAMALGNQPANKKRTPESRSRKSAKIEKQANYREQIVAGTGRANNNGDRGPATETNIGDPFGVELGPDGALYVTEVKHHRVRRIDLRAGTISTVAGCGRKGYSGDGGPATDAELNEPYEVRFDDQGNMYFVEMQNHLVRRVDTRSGIITTIAGTGQQGYGGDRGPATQATFNRPHSIALDGQGGLYIADIGNHRIRRVDLRTGMLESIAGTGERKLPQDGQLARDRPVLGPRALFVQGETLWVALREGHSVWTLDLAGGRWSHVAGTGKQGFSGDGGPAKTATFNGPKGIAVGPAGNVYVVDTENHAIRRINIATGTIATVAGRSRRGRRSAREKEPTLSRPHGVCVGTDGVIYIGDTLNHRVIAARRVAP
jgi:arylsulfatase A-like enzyme/DNA-binding beta-propeller fold protein YncE